MTKIQPQLIYIEWCDAMTSEATWMTETEALAFGEDESWVNKEVGFLIKETGKYLLIASQTSHYDENELKYGNVTKIPTTWIMKRKNINV